MSASVRLAGVQSLTGVGQNHEERHQNVLNGSERSCIPASRGNSLCLVGSLLRAEPSVSSWQEVGVKSDSP